MTVRHSLMFLALTLGAAAGCAGARSETRGDEAKLVAYARRSSDVTSSAPARGLVVKIEPIRGGTLHDPARMMELRISMERQISTQVKDLSEERYRDVARPRLAEALLAAGLEQADVDYILHGVDYHRSL